MENTETRETFDHWAVIELFGHQRIAGRVREEVLFGAALCRVDVPAVEGREAYTKYFGSGAIYALTPTSEEVAKLVAAQIWVAPVEVALRKPQFGKQLTLTTEQERDFNEAADAEESWR